MFMSNAFDYINVMDKAADASWLRNEVIANNIANVDTPGYKREDIAFEEELQKALGDSRYKSMDSKVSSVNEKLNQLNPAVVQDYDDYSYRIDKNNVDIDTENVTLAANQLKYQGLMNCVTHEFNDLRTAMQ
ncbi:MAG: flagellar basal body rod protein FlgB [Butyrivibrio sp.]|nr:flagellar basal body rod protein FlgB [Butyrivibrio sp.]